MPDVYQPTDPLSLRLPDARRNESSHEQRTRNVNWSDRATSAHASRSEREICVDGSATVADAALPCHLSAATQVALSYRTIDPRAPPSLLALNGLRVSKAIGADIERLGLERGHRTLTIVRKGGKIVTIPLRPAPLGRSISLSANAARARSSSEPTAAPRPSRRQPDRASRRPPSRHRQAGRPSHAAPHVHNRRARRRVPLRDVQEAASHAEPRTAMRYDRARVTLD